MGWTSYHATHYKDGKVNRKAECDAYFTEGLNEGHFRVLKSSINGSVYYAAIKELTKYAGKDEDGIPIYIPEENGKVRAVVFLTSVRNGSYYNFSYKSMDESYGPGYYDCPASILKLLDKTDHEIANKWRNNCWKNIEKKRDLYALHNLPVGTIIEFKSENDMLSGIKKGDIVRLTKYKNFQKKRKSFWANGRYRWSSKMIPESYKVIV
jgi:hypothetical protein